MGVTEVVRVLSSWRAAVLRALVVAGQDLVPSVQAYFHNVSFEFGGAYSSFHFL